MKLVALALFVLAACSVSAAPPSEQRVRYSAHFAAGADEAALAKVVEAYKQRLGKTAGDASFRTDAKAGTITVELPVSAAFTATKPEGTLATALVADAHVLAFTTEERVPVHGLAHVDDEWLRYDELGGERGLFGTQVAAHGAGAKLQVFEDDFVRTLLGAYGEIEFLAAQDPQLEGEHERFATWRKAHPGARLEEFDTRARAEGGPLPGTLWRRHRSSGEHALLVRSADPRFRFGNADIASAGFSQDRMGYPAVSFELKKERTKDFGDWTESILGHGLAIVRDDEILTLATVRSRLPGGGIIEGGAGVSSRGEARALVTLLRLPLLPLPPLSLTLEFVH
jgi:preprotein translocase subunit SecD